MRALILIDIQRGFDAPAWGARNNPGAEIRAARLLDHWRRQAAPIVHVRHVSAEPGSPLGRGPGAEFKAEAMPRPGETIIEKSVNSAFIGTDLEAHLRGAGAQALVICGLTTPHCVSTTTRMAANLGFDVTLAHDACAAFSVNSDRGWHSEPAAAPDPEMVHRAAIDHLHGEFCRAESVADILVASR